MHRLRAKTQMNKQNKLKVDDLLDTWLDSAREMGADIALIHASLVAGTVSLERACIESGIWSEKKAAECTAKAIAFARKTAMAQIAQPNN